jgi:putative transcriptional regulator
MDDPQFEHAVILMVEHGDDGAMGLVLNRPMQTAVEEVWDQISAQECPLDQPLLAGGPCDGPLMLLHDRPSWAQVKVCPGVCFTADESMVRELLSESPAAVRFFLGYAGWGPGQIEDELSRGGWLVTPASSEVVFDPDADDGLWMRVITGIDRSLAMLAMNPRLMPRDPSMN